jgi:hypothetical protein
MAGQYLEKTSLRQHMFQSLKCASSDGIYVMEVLGRRCKMFGSGCSFSSQYDLETVVVWNVCGHFWQPSEVFSGASFCGRVMVIYSLLLEHYIVRTPSFCKMLDDLLLI